MLVLGIETSCDDTSLALFERERGVVAEYTAHQLVHDLYGGIVPEIASRTHMRNLLPVFEEMMKRSGQSRADIDGIGVSNGPGLVGSLLVGVGFAKALGLALERPVVGVHHVEAHILSNELGGEPLKTPAIVLIVSGGHTALYRVEKIGRYELVGSTRDDAAGECFDKVAKLLGLGFPGGPAVEKVAAAGDRESVTFPRAMMTKDNFDFSFSGLKTSVRLHVESVGNTDAHVVADVAASAQEAIVDALSRKTIRCAKHHRLEHVYLAGGVAANRCLRDRLQSLCEREGMSYHAPLLKYCTDNGAMVACAAEKLLVSGRNDGQSIDVFARGQVTSWA